MSFMPLTGLPRCACSYGERRPIRHIAAGALCTLALLLPPIERSGFAQTPDRQTPIQIVALGDSLTAGLGLPERDGFVPRLQAALALNGIAANVTNAGVSGDTATDGLARLDWSVPESTNAVIVELGANDMLRGIKPDVTRSALDSIVKRLRQRHIAVMLCGMRAAPNLGTDYAQGFEPIYPELAAKYGALLYPFFLDGVAGNLKLTQPDGMHPNAEGVAIIVARILPKVLELVGQIHSQAQHPS